MFCNWLLGPVTRKCASRRVLPPSQSPDSGGAAYALGAGLPSPPRSAHSLPRFCPGAQSGWPESLAASHQPRNCPYNRAGCGSRTWVPDAAVVVVVCAASKLKPLLGSNRCLFAREAWEPLSDAVATVSTTKPSGGKRLALSAFSRDPLAPGDVVDQWNRCLLP